MPEKVLRMIAGWKKIPETYFATLTAEEAAAFHREISPADRLNGKRNGKISGEGQKSRGKL